MAKKQPHALLLTGPPGVGKTTVLRRAAAALQGSEIRGFTTEEIRENGERVGFRIETFDGESAVLAHVRIRSPQRIGKYGVDLATLDRIVAEQFPRESSGRSPRAVGEAVCSGRTRWSSEAASKGLVMIDEIGKMECLSPRFVETVEALLDSARVIVATVALRGGDFIQAVKRRPDVLPWQVSRSNREELPAKVAAWVREDLAPGPGGQ